nr:MAG TPA: hypothetical protein [Caudoviricetes sp.]
MTTLLARGQITIAAIKDGTDGKDAISILVEDSPIIFDTNDNGIVPTGISKSAKVKVMKGNTNVTNDCSGINSMDSMCVNCKCGAVQKDEYIEVSISGSNITKNDVIVDGVNQGQVSATSGYAVAQLTYNSVVYFAQVPFSVNVAKFTGVVAINNQQYEAKFTEISNRFNNTPTNKDLKESESRMTQTAREISLSVSEKSIARRNLLVGSDFRKQTNDFIISNDARIEMNSGYQGTNCIKVIDDTEAGNLHYVGVYWDGSQGGKSIKIEKGKKYTISCWYFTNDTNASLYLEAIYTDKQTNATRKGQATYLSPNNFSPKYKQWQLFTTVIDTTDAKTDYIAFNFWEGCNVGSGRIQAWICRPMVEEGAEYNGWTLSDKDYDYVGANLIDNSRTFELGGNVIRVVGTKKLVGDAYELSATLGDDYNTFYEIDNSAFKLNTDYTISFEVKGDAKYMGVFVYYKPTNTPWAYCKEQQDNPLYEANGDGKTDGYGVLLEVKDLSDKQQKVWSHFKFKERLPESIYLQFPKNQDQSGVTSWTVSITKPKIEEGAVVSEWTEKKTDIVEKTELKAAGININKDSVEIYGDRVKVSQTKGGTPIALFGSNGKINGSFIETNNLFLSGFMYKSKNTKPVYTNYPLGSKAQYIDIAKSGSWLEMCPFDETFRLPCTKLVGEDDYNDSFDDTVLPELFKEENNIARSLVGSTVIIYNVPSQYNGSEYDMRIESSLMSKSKYYKWMTDDTTGYELDTHVIVKCGQMISLECICSRYQSSLKNADGIFEKVWTEHVIWLYEIGKYSKWGVGNN